jgi:hypothetical protein
MAREIMEKDIYIAIKKAKTRFRFERKFYILDYKPYYFASGNPEKNRETEEDIYKELWIFDENKKRWIKEG